MAAMSTSVVAHTAAEAASQASDQGTRTAVRSRARHIAPPRTASPTSGSAVTIQIGTSACTEVTQSWMPPMMAMKTAAVTTMPTYLPSRNCHRWIGLGKMT